MKNIILVVFALVVFVACKANHSNGLEEEPQFQISFIINQDAKGEYALAFEILPDTGYYFVSPHSKGFHQRLLFSTENTENLFLDGKLLESPIIWEEYDKATGKQGSFVRGKTTYLQKLLIHSENDFKVAGLIWLEILPNNQPYEIWFEVINESGKLRVAETKNQESNYPSFSDKKRLDIPLQ